jgi:hypothetical protein
VFSLIVLLKQIEACIAVLPKYYRKWFTEEEVDDWEALVRDGKLGADCLPHSPWHEVPYPRTVEEFWHVRPLASTSTETTGPNRFQTASVLRVGATRIVPAPTTQPREEFVIGQFCAYRDPGSGIGYTVGKLVREHADTVDVTPYKYSDMSRQVWYYVQRDCARQVICKVDVLMCSFKTTGRNRFRKEVITEVERRLVLTERHSSTSSSSSDSSSRCSTDEEDV